MRKEMLGWVALLPALILYYIGTLSVHALALISIAVLLLIVEQVRLTSIKNKSHLRLQIAPTGEKNAEINGQLEVKNDALLPMIRGECLLEIHNMMTDQKTETVLPFAVSGKSKDVFHLEFRPKHYGGYRATIRKITHLDFSGSFTREKVISVQAKTTVFPEIVAHWDDWYLGEIANKESDIYSEHKKGNDPGEIFGLREYEPGDAIKFIHWKLTAKTDKTMIRELGYPIDNTIMLYYETRLPEGEMNPEDLDRYTRRFAGAAMYFVEQHQQFTIGYYNEEIKKYCFDEIGTEQQLYNSLTDILDQSRTKAAGTSLEEYHSYEIEFGTIYYFSLGEKSVPAHLASVVNVIMPIFTEVKNENK